MITTQTSNLNFINTYKTAIDNLSNKWCLATIDTYNSNLYWSDNNKIWYNYATTGTSITPDIIKEAKKQNKENNMLKIINVEISKEKKVIVDETKRDENGNYVVTKVEVPTGTIVTFENGHTQTAYCDESDEFNLEVGIGICVTRELMYRLYGTDGESNTYNKVIRSGIKAYNKNEKARKAVLKAIEENKAIAEARKAKEQKRRIKKAEKKKEREIEIMAEAIRRANADNK